MLFNEVQEKSLNDKKLFTIKYYDADFKKCEVTDWYEDAKQAKHHFYVEMKAKERKYSLIKIINNIDLKIKK